MATNKLQILTLGKDRSMTVKVPENIMAEWDELTKFFVSYGYSVAPFHSIATDGFMGALRTLRKEKKAIEKASEEAEAARRAEIEAEELADFESHFTS